MITLRTWVGAGIGLAAAVLIAGTAHSRGQAAASKPTSKERSDEPTGQDAESQIEIWARYAMPGQPHRLLDRVVGHWETVTTYRMNAQTEPVDAKGRCERKWILGRRFVQEDLDGGNLVLPFKGLGLFGYDAFEKKYTCAWMDTTSTAMLTYQGVYREQDDAVGFVGVYGDPWTGVKKKCRGVMRFTGDDKHVLELYVPDATGEEYRILEIVYTRRALAPKTTTPE